MKIEKMKSNSGNVVKNQIVIKNFKENSNAFQSYQTIIAIESFEEGEWKVKLSEAWDCSRTTLKYLCKFLGVSSKKEIEKGIRNGTYKVSESDLTIN